MYICLDKYVHPTNTIKLNLLILILSPVTHFGQIIPASIEFFVAYPKFQSRLCGDMLKKVIAMTYLPLKQHLGPGLQRVVVLYRILATNCNQLKYVRMKYELTQKPLYYIYPRYHGRSRSDETIYLIAYH